MPFTVLQKSFLLTAVAILSLALPTHSQAKKRATASPFRSITVVSAPDAIVWIDGIRFGKTDKSGKLEIRTISAGAHTLRIRADGFSEKSFLLTAAKRGVVNVELIDPAGEAELAYQEAERLTGVDREKSADAYRNAIKLKANYPEAYLGLARVLSDAGELEDAKIAAAAARRLRPSYAEASAVEGRIHKENGDEAKAIAAFKRAIAEGKGFQPEAYTGLGLLYKEKAEGFGGSGDFDNEAASYTESAKNLKTAVKQLSGAPDTIIIYQILGLIYERQKKYTEAIATYEAFLRIFPDSIEATAVRSFIVQLKKDITP